MGEGGKGFHKVDEKMLSNGKWRTCMYFWNISFVFEYLSNGFHIYFVILLSFSYLKNFTMSTLFVFFINIYKFIIFKSILVFYTSIKIVSILCFIIQKKWSVFRSYILYINFCTIVFDVIFTFNVNCFALNFYCFFWMNFSGNFFSVVLHWENHSFSSVQWKWPMHLQVITLWLVVLV